MQTCHQLDFASWSPACHIILRGDVDPANELLEPHRVRGGSMVPVAFCIGLIKVSQEYEGDHFCLAWQAA